LAVEGVPSTGEASVVPGEIIPIVALLIIPVTAIGVPIARAFARRIDRLSAQPRVPPEVNARLERMEQGMDAIAIEVERISEGQRFVTKLLSEGRAPPNRVPSSTDVSG
jgi:hypothetical protein